MEAARWEEGEAFDAGCGQLAVPVGRHRVGVAEEMETVNPGFPRQVGPIHRGDEGHVSEQETRYIRAGFRSQPSVFRRRHRCDAELSQSRQIRIALGFQGGGLT